MPSNVSSCVRLFADDCVVYRGISSSTDATILQHDLDAINTWCSTWLLSLNVSKCAHITFTRSQHRSVRSYLLGASLVSKVHSYKYLGVHLTSNLSWSNHINAITNEANRSLGYFLRNLKAAPSSVKHQAFTTLVRPKLEYCSSVWDPHYLNLVSLLESVQNRAARFIANNYSYPSSISSIKLSLQLPDLSLRRKYFRLCLFFKFYRSPHLRPSYVQPASYISARVDHTLKVSRLRCRSQHFSYSFFPWTITEWNALPQTLVTITNFETFKNALNQHLGL